MKLRSSCFIQKTMLIADPSAYSSALCQNMLRGFGAKKAVEARSAEDAIESLQAQKLAALICDIKLPETGFDLVLRIRRNPSFDFRRIPILFTADNPCASIVAKARDCGANMVAAKPLSPNSLYERLSWVLSDPRKFIDAPNYFGPDRRFKIEGFPNGVGRRNDDHVSLSSESGPSMSQTDIDQLFKTSVA